MNNKNESNKKLDDNKNIQNETESIEPDQENIVTTTTVPIHQMNPEKLKKEAKEGNLRSYKMLFMYYDGKKLDEDFLFISKLMYEKYNQSVALNSIYMAYIYKYNPNVEFLRGNLPELLKNVPHQEQKEAINYLKKGVELGEYSCIEDLSDYYLSIGEEEKSKELLELQDKLIEEHKQRVNKLP